MKRITGHDLIAAGWTPGPGYNEAIRLANVLLSVGWTMSEALAAGIEKGKIDRAAYIPRRERKQRVNVSAWLVFKPIVMGSWLPWSADGITTETITINETIEVRNRSEGFREAIVSSSIWEFRPLTEVLRGTA